MKGKKKTTAGSAMDGWLDAAKKAESKGRAKAPPAPEGKPETQHATFRVDVELLDRVKNAVVALGGEERMTLTRFVGEAMQAHLLKLERKYNGGKPFKQRSGPVKTGRPLRS